MRAEITFSIDLSDLPQFQDNGSNLSSFFHERFVCASYEKLTEHLAESKRIIRDFGAVYEEALKKELDAELVLSKALESSMNIRIS